MGLKTFEPEYETPVLFEKGAGHCTFRISDKHVAKFGWDFKYLKEDEILGRVVREFEVLEDLYKNGVSVPEPEGVFNISSGFFSRVFRRVRPAMVMSYIPGEDFHDNLYNAEGYGWARVLRDVELDKAQMLGYEPSLDAPLNAILSPEKKVFLFDFEGWTDKNGVCVHTGRKVR